MVDVAIRANIEELKAATDIERASEIEEALDYYDSQSEQYVKRFAGEPTEHYTSRPKLAVSLCRDIICRVSRIYDRPPIRELTGNVPAGFVEMMARKWRRGRMNLHDQYLDRMTRYLGTTAERIVWNPTSGEVDFQPILPDAARITQDPDDPSAAIAVAIETTTPASVGSDTIRVVTIYTDDEIMRFVDDKQVAWNDQGDDENPYGIIPIVWRHNDLEPRQFWATGWHVSLVNANETVNNHLAAALRNAEWQGFSIPVLSDCEMQTGQGISPGQPIQEKLGPNASSKAGFRFETPRADTAGMLQLLTAIMDLTYQTHGLSQSPLRMQTLPSGLALAISRVDLLDDWAGRQQHWTDYEHERARRALRVWCYHTGTRVPDDNSWELTVDWQRPQIPTSDADKWRSYVLRLTNDLASRADILQEENPELSADAALEEAERIMCENNPWRGGGQTATDVVTAATAAFRSRQDAEEGAA